MQSKSQDLEQIDQRNMHQCPRCAQHGRRLQYSERCNHSIGTHKGSVEITNEEKEEDWDHITVHCWLDVGLSLPSLFSLCCVVESLEIDTLLIPISAPIFSIIGWVVRERYSSSLDITYHDPMILLWAYVLSCYSPLADALTQISAAELSTGFICVCLPTIPVLLQRRKNGQGDQSLEKNSRSRYLRTLTHKRPKTLSEQDLSVNGNYLELGESSSHDGGIRTPPTAVTTDIEGGKPCDIHDFAPMDLELEEEELGQRPAIMKTVVVEQSHKARK